MMRNKVVADFFSKTFDFVCSIGEDCACASYIRNFMLHDGAYPFDWLTKADFETRIDLICNDFSGFFEEQDFRKIEKSSLTRNDEKNDYYENIKTGFYFYHDFTAGVPFKDVFSLVEEKYTRRIARFYEKISQSDHVLFVWWSRDKQIDDGVMRECYFRLIKKFKGKAIHLLILGNTQCPSAYNVMGLEKNLIRINYHLADDMSVVMGIQPNTNAIFRQIKKDGLRWSRLKNSSKRFLLNTLCCFIPIRSIRRKIRAKLMRFKQFDY